MCPYYPTHLLQIAEILPKPEEYYLMHGAETRTRALSLRADTLKRCYTRDLQKDSNPQLISLRNEYNPYATPTLLVVIGVVVVVVVVGDDGVDVDMYESLLTVTSSRNIVGVPFVPWAFRFCLQYFERGNSFYSE